MRFWRVEALKFLTLFYSMDPLPRNLFKLNFDGNYTRGENQRGIGGVIRSHDGTTICNYSVVVGVSNANEDEIYSLPIGCRELQRLFGFK